MKVLFFYMIVFACFSCHQKDAGKTKSITTAMARDSIKKFSLQSIVEERIMKGKFSKDTIQVKNIKYYLSFQEGNILSNTKTHCLASVRTVEDFKEFVNEDIQIFIYENKATKWILKREILKKGMILLNTNIIEDANFDGTKDIVLRWQFQLGKCNCGNQGCKSIYLYDEKKNNFTYKDELEDYLEVSIVPKEKAIYLGNHCESSTWYKCKWNKFDLEVSEEITFDNEEAFYMPNSKRCKRSHFLYDSKYNKILKEKVNNCDLPNNWKANLRY